MQSVKALCVVCVLATSAVIFANSNAAIVEKKMALADTTLSYIESGEGETVIFLHGAIGDLHAWSGYQDLIAKNHRFIAYSRRFHDGPPPSTDSVNYDHEVHAEDLAEFIRALDVGAVHLVTHSSGAYTASIVAARYPALLKSMIQFEPITTSRMMKGVPHYQTYSDEWDAKWVAVGEQLDAGDLRHAMRKFVENVFELPRGGFESLDKENQQRFLNKAYIIPILFSGETTVKTDCDYVSSIQTPTLVVLGTQTHRAFSMEVERMADCLPKATLKLMPGSNHSAPMKDREGFIKIIEDFIAQQS